MDAPRRPPREPPSRHVDGSTKGPATSKSLGPPKGGSTKGTKYVGTVEVRVREAVAGAEVGEGVPRRCSPGKCHPGGNL